MKLQIINFSAAQWLTVTKIAAANGSQRSKRVPLNPCFFTVFQ